MGWFTRQAPRMPLPHEALPGRGAPAFRVEPTHAVNGAPTVEPFPPGTALAMFGMGCFWGAERALWRVVGVVSTQVGYAAGSTPHPTYREVCTGLTGHNEVVRVVYDPAQMSYDQLLATFWERHDPTQGMRQGNDVGTQYRSGRRRRSPRARSSRPDSCGGTAGARPRRSRTPARRGSPS